MDEEKLEKLAHEIFEEIRRLGLDVKVEGNWVVLSPPAKIPTYLSMKLLHCPDKAMEILISLINNKTKIPPREGS